MIRETKAQELGVKPGVVSKRAKRTTALIRSKLEALAYEWSEIDGGVETEIQALYDNLDAIDVMVDDAVLTLRRPRDDA